jgi:phosphopantetheine--protein transferase-like protein
MIVGCGIDLVRISRIKKIIAKWDDCFLKRIYTQIEIDYCESKNERRYQSYAGYFAAKEAWVKAIGTGFREIKWKEIEIRNNNMGKPEIYLSNRLNKITKEKGIINIQLSISHVEGLAVALVIIEN